ncbi:RING-type domain-containing protein [Heracleum sosnowskyi]|uniref:RING-type E3 ubiquitin transferase n=1 Tax=Heracleum sosnowskyi TaxID=360622 RepID=A0AAD8M282_9APIA|nr:RING-type domain-containing protein [Heracleum sosnowskyi]
MSSPAHIDLTWTKSFAHRQICEFNVKVSESDGIVAPGDFQVLGMFPAECSTSSVSFSFADLRSPTRGYDLCQQQVLNSQPHMRPATVGFLVHRIVDYGMKLVSLHGGEDDVDFGYVIDARLDFKYFRLADEEDLALCRQFDEMEEDDGIEDYDRDENEDDIEGVEIDEDDDEDIYDMDDEANPRFRGVEEGRYNGGDGKQVIMCSVCLEDLSSGMEFNKLPCSHIFHTTCIEHWLKRNTSCPNCRTQLTKLEE